METKHSWASVLDLPEILPFAIKEDLDDKYIKDLFKFVDDLSKSFGEKIFYIGQDTIGEKFYERFMFEKNGFLEVMVQAPVAIIAHFVTDKRAQEFSDALKKVLTKMKSQTAKMVAEAVEVQTEKEQTLDYKTWAKLREIRGD